MRASTLRVNGRSHTMLLEFKITAAISTAALVYCAIALTYIAAILRRQRREDGR